MPFMHRKREATTTTDTAKGALLRCPHCGEHFSEGGVASPEPGAQEFDQEHEAEMGQASRTREYDKEFRHYYGDGEAGFSSGGMARAQRRFDKGAESNSDESFTGYLAKRRAVRGARSRKEG